MTSIILIILLFLAFLFSKYYSKKTTLQREKYQKDLVNNIRENWTQIKIKTSDCQIIKFDQLINEDKIEKEDENFFEWINNNPSSEKKVIQKRSKLICNHKQNNKIEKQFVKIIDIDYTVLEFKIKIQDYINVYIPNSYDLDDYFIDLEFLDKPIFNKH